MLSKNKIKEIRKLHLAKYRHEQQCFIAEGPKLFEELLQSNFIILEAFSTTPFDLPPHRANLPLQLISASELESISLLSSPNQVFAIVQTPPSNIIYPEKDELILALDNIQDPGNLGTIIRIADWFGIHKLVCAPQTADRFNPKVVQSTMGAILRTQMCYTPLNDYFIKIKDTHLIYGALLEGQNIYETPLSKGGVILIGNESKGINQDLMPYISKQIRIPSYNASNMESLNAAVATGIICAEFRRQNSN